MEAHTRQRIEEFPAVCRNSGLKVTPQRSAIFAMLADTDGHPTPEEVYSAIRAATPSISLATVYKILDLFHKRGFVRRVSTRDQVMRYDANLTPHHHLICNACGQIQDVAVDDISGPKVTTPRTEGFQIESLEIQFHGLCKDCRT